MAKKSKRYQEAAKLIEKGKAYSVEEAVELVKKTSTVKFDAAVDVAFKLGVDPRQANQQLRGALVLPHGTGKTKKVLVVTCLLYTSPSPRDRSLSRMPSSA